MIITEHLTSSLSSPAFIVLEGVNGAGKTTLQTRLAHYFSQKGREVVTTREPGATSLGKSIRNLVVEYEGGSPSPLAELFLFAADRAEHVEKVIKPALRRREIVICDRYCYSSIAFQGYGRLIDIELVKQINRLAIQDTKPDLVVLLDLPPEEGLRRNKQLSLAEKGKDAFEGKELEFHQRIRDGFLKIAEEDLTPFLIVNAARTPEQIFQEVSSFIDRLSSL